MCRACWNEAARLGQLDNYPPLSLRARGALLDEYVFLRESGVRARHMAARLGMKQEAFERAMCRARRAGDPRAQTWRGLAA